MNLEIAQQKKIKTFWNFSSFSIGPEVKAKTYFPLIPCGRDVKESGGQWKDSHNWNFFLGEQSKI
jgi:hypothetical protein